MTHGFVGGGQSRGGPQDIVLHVCRACRARSSSHVDGQLHRRLLHHGSVRHFMRLHGAPHVNVFALYHLLPELAA